MQVRICAAAFLILSAFPSGPAQAATFSVPETHARVTDALAAAGPGDTVQVAAGTYAPGTNGESYPLVIATDGVRLLGAGMKSSVLDAEGAGSVLEIAATGVVVRGFSLTGGVAALGGGVHVQSGDPEIAECLIHDNAVSTRGSGIYATGGAIPWIHHNVIWENRDTHVPSGGDPHGIQLDGAHGLVEHNLIGRGDSNGLLTENGSAPVIRNNIFYRNGTPGLRGRGICSLGDQPGTTIAHNLFFGNEIAPILVFGETGPEDYSASEANDLHPRDGIYGNLEGDPLFVDESACDWTLEALSPAIDSGDTTGGAMDPDGTPPDAGPFHYAQVVAAESPLPASLKFLPPWPNPAAGSTQLRFELPRPGAVRLTIHDVRGRQVAEILDETLKAGVHRIVWAANATPSGRVPPGLYLARLRTEDAVRVRRILLL